MIRAGACEYGLEYVISPEHRDAFFDRRDAFLEAELSSNGQAPRLQRLPTDRCILRGDYLEFDTQAAGAFGWIRKASTSRQAIQWLSRNFVFGIAGRLLQL